jgi:superfamily II DNA helicase RecQ
VLEIGPLPNGPHWSCVPAKGFAFVQIWKLLSSIDLPSSIGLPWQVRDIAGIDEADEQHYNTMLRGHCIGISPEKKKARQGHPVQVSSRPPFQHTQGALHLGRNAPHYQMGYMLSDYYRAPTSLPAWQQMAPSAPTKDACSFFEQNIGYTPFGIFCRPCGSKLETTCRSLQHHFSTHHCTEPSYSSTKQFLPKASERLQEVILGGDIEKYISVAGTLFSCACGISFSRIDNLTKHRKKAKQPLCASQHSIEKRYATTCGRYVSESEVEALRRRAATATLLSQEKEQDFERTVAFLSPMVPADEDVAFYRPVFHPWAHPFPDAIEMADALRVMVASVHADPRDDETELAFLLAEGGPVDIFIMKIEQFVQLVSADLRHQLNNWVTTGQFIGETSQNTTFNVRYKLSTLIAELRNMIRFVLRHESKTSFLDEGIKTSITRAIDGHPDCSPADVVSLILVQLVKESPESNFVHPVALQFAMTRCCVVKKEELSLRACGGSASTLSCVLHLLKCAVCAMIAVSKGTREQHAALIEEAKKSRTFNMLGPWIRSFKTMDSKKPPQTREIVTPDGHVVIESIMFPVELWTNTIPLTNAALTAELEQLFDGPTWKLFMNGLPMSVTRLSDGTLDASIVLDEVIHTMSGLKIAKLDKGVMQSALARIAGYLDLAFHSFGGGASREAEVHRIQLSQLMWYSDSIYYVTESKKHYSFSRPNHAKLTHRKLPRETAVLFLLFRRICVSVMDASVFALPTFDGGSTIGPAAQAIFKLDCTPTALNVRKLMASISNLLDTQIRETTKLEADAKAAGFFGHTVSTHRSAYSSRYADADELHYRKYHRLLGYEETPPPLSSFELTDFDLLRALHHLHGQDANYKSSAQQKMVQLAAKPVNKHVHVSLSCGGGKSLAWEVTLVAACLSGKRLPTVFVVLPYCFLQAYHTARATATFERCGCGDIVAVSVPASECAKPDLPECLQDVRYLPNLVFLSIDGLAHLLRRHLSVFAAWGRDGHIHRFILDEIHTLYDEHKFRPAYDALLKIAECAVPIMTLSGTVPQNMILSLCRYLKMAGSLDDVELVVQKDTLLGSYPSSFFFKVSESDDCIAAVVQELEMRVSSCPEAAVHVICTTKDQAGAITTSCSAPSLSHLRRELVSSDTPREQQERISAAWAEGTVDVLVSTTCALVGNESSRCRAVLICGNLYNLKSLVQAIGRLRPTQREGGLVGIFLTRMEPYKMRENDEQLVQRLQHRSLLDDRAKDSFMRVGTLTGLRDWASDVAGCRIASLSRAFEIIVDPCRACDVCRAQPVAVLADLAAGERQKSLHHAQEAGRALHYLKKYCMVCGQEGCDGDNADCVGRGCLRCGSSSHSSKGCPINYGTIAEGRFCHGCLDCKSRPGFERHAIQDCPFQRRIRRLLIGEFIFNPKETHISDAAIRDRNFESHAKRVLADMDTFHKFLSKAYTKRFPAP